MGCRFYYAPWMANASPSAPSLREPAVFGTSIEALVQRTLGTKLSAATVAKLAELKIDLSNLRVAYEYRIWMALLEHLATSIYPNLALDAAYRELGKDYLRG